MKIWVSFFLSFKHQKQNKMRWTQLDISKCCTDQQQQLLVTYNILFKSTNDGKLDLQTQSSSSSQLRHCVAAFFRKLVYLLPVAKIYLVVLFSFLFCFVLSSTKTKCICICYLQRDKVSSLNL